MIISRTPYRISFFGGGADYPVWFNENKGAVLAASINHHCYLSVRYLPPFFDHKSYASYSKVETVQSNDDFQHPAIREILRYLKMTDGVQIHHDGDLPARTGIGSSSSFAVGLLNALYLLKGEWAASEQLAKEAIYIEREILKENVGSQDQIMAAYGGFNRVDFHKDGFQVTPLKIDPERKNELQNHLVLYFTGTSRNASEIAKTQIQETKKKSDVLSAMYALVERGAAILTSKKDLREFGELIHEGWELKRSITSKISTPEIDELYARARKAGALGGKLIGAGGGGFLLFFVPPEKRGAVDRAMEPNKGVRVEFQEQGSEIIFAGKRG